MKCPNINTEEFSSLKNEKEELYFYFKDSYGDIINKKNSLGFYIQGLKEIGEGKVNASHVSQIKNIIGKSHEEPQIKLNMRYAPVWIQKIVSKILNDLNNG